MCINLPFLKITFSTLLFQILNFELPLLYFFLKQLAALITSLGLGE